jgi:predicted unusual protein kinase regulating ubiquinone biosynthesis (AarF/ABC1/UbiB family)
MASRCRLPARSRPTGDRCAVNTRQLPKGRLQRLAALAGAGVRTGAAVLLKKDGGGAQAAAEVLGQLRGVAAKVGQMMSYVDGMAPPAHAQQFQAAMSALRAAAPASPFPEVQAVLRQELGGPWDQHFSAFEEKPLASASIGQVHRARLKNGTAVAVKIQHPGVAEALEADLRNSGVLDGLVGAMGGRRINSSGMFEELRARLREELDYSLEAAAQQRFAAIHRGDPTIRIPAIHTALSSRRVLVSDWADGVDFDTACRAPVEQREAWARTLWRFVFKGNLVDGLFNADPHPGNYIFQPDGAVSFVDFGCVQPIDRQKLILSRRMHRAASHGDEQTFRATAPLYAGTRPGAYQDMAVTFMRRCFDPVFHSPYRMTRAYCADLFTTLTGMARASAELSDEDVTPMPSGILFMNRMNFGFYSVLARLDVAVDYASVERAFLPTTEDA